MSLPTTSKDWQLYTSSMKCGIAAQALTAALKQVIKAMDTMCPLNAQNVARVMSKHLDPVMSKYAEYGACDTEPRYVARRAIVRAVCDKMGWEYDSFSARNFAAAIY
jgi:hypothetical protein